MDIIRVLCRNAETYPFQPLCQHCSFLSRKLQLWNKKKFFPNIDVGYAWWTKCQHHWSASEPALESFPSPKDRAVSSEANPMIYSPLFQVGSSHKCKREANWSIDHGFLKVKLFFLSKVGYYKCLQGTHTVLLALLGELNKGKSKSLISTVSYPYLVALGELDQSLRVDGSRETNLSLTHVSFLNRNIKNILQFRQSSLAAASGVSARSTKWSQSKKTRSNAKPGSLNHELGRHPSKKNDSLLTKVFRWGAPSPKRVYPKRPVVVAPQ